MFWLFLVGVVSVSYTGRYQLTDRIDYTGIHPKPSAYDSAIVDKKVMILGDDRGLYRRNHLGGYFLDWRLSEKYFEQTDEYGNIILIHESISRDAPDIIVDEANRMPALVERIPDLKVKYRQEGKIYRRK